MGHKSFIKGSITHLSLGFSRYLSLEHFNAAAAGWGKGAGGGAMTTVPLRSQSAPAALAVMEVSTLE